MVQIITWIVIILILLFILKIGSFLWRFLGFLAIIFLIWVFKDDILQQADQVVNYFQTQSAGEIIGHVVDGAKGIFTGVKDWVTTTIEQL